MKYEISDLLNDKYKYGLTKLRMHKKVNKAIIPILILKLSASDYIIIHVLFIIISSLGSLILCNDFIPDYNNNIYFSNWLRYFTAFSLISKLKLSHHGYIIICSIIYIICLIRMLIEGKLIYNIYHYHRTEAYKLKENFIARILNHIVFISFPYLIEFFSFIYYIELLPNDFIIKKNPNINGIHNFFCVLNGIFIIIYNINNYLLLIVANRPSADKSYPLRTLMPTSKLYVLIIFQNFILIHPFEYYLMNDIKRIWCIIYSIIFFLLLLYAYFINIKLYNYDNFINSLLSFIGEFCFISIIIEIILYFFSINHNNKREILIFFLIKIIISLCLFFSLNLIYQKIMMKKIKKRLFYNNPCNTPFDSNMTNSILYIREIFEQKNLKYLNQIQEYIIKHQKQCSNFHCGCKIIKIKNNFQIGDKLAFIEDLIKKLNYYIESILIHYNYQNNFELSILLSEHFQIFKNNPLMSYSILQTYLHFNYENSSKEKLIIIYELMNKYINYALLEKAGNINFEKNSQNISNIKKIVKEAELNQYFNFLIKIKTAIKFIVYYSRKFIKIINHKDNYENSTIIKMNKIYNEISDISSPYLSKKILKELIEFFSEEINYTSEIQKYLYDLEEYNKILPFEFLYKIFLFVDYFWNGKIPDNLKNIFYGFSSNHNLNSSEINSDIYCILEKKYNEVFSHTQIKYYLLFKLAKGIKITYISESFTRKLNYKQIDLINSDISLLLIKDLIEPHENAIKQYFILKQNNVSKEKCKFVFDRKGYMINSKIFSTLQIGINKNILIISIIEINQKNKEICFYANNSLNIISINRNFENFFFLSLSLIQELKLELNDLFGININDIRYNYLREVKKARNIRELMTLNTNEYILKNLFKNKNQNNTYYILNKFIIKHNELDIENEEEKLLKEKENQKTILKKLQNLFDNKTKDILFIPITFEISRENYISNLKKIIEKINFYEQDKLERKNIYADFIKLNDNYNLQNYKNMNFDIEIEPRLIYDTTLYYCKIHLSIFQKIIEINSPKNKEKEYNSIEIETEEINYIHQNTKNKIKRQKTFLSMFPFKERKKSNKKIIGDDSYYYRERIKSSKVSEYKLCIVLLFFILVLLISCIITLNYQTSLVYKNDKIFDALYYNYYQRTQFIYLNAITLSIFYELENISNQSVIVDNKDVLRLIGQNIEASHQLFIRYYMDFKIEIDEDFSNLYTPLTSNKITVNWENRIFNNDYNCELALIIYRIIDSSEHEFNADDIFDCDNLLLSNYLNIDRQKTPVYGNFIKLIYYFYINYETQLRQYFLSLENSFDESLDNFSKRTTYVYIILEILAIISFLLFFVINIYFLVNSNKYIFLNILYMFLDFTQKDEYTFNNKYFNTLTKNRIYNYILVLNDFTPKNLESLRKDKEIVDITTSKKLDLKIKSSLIEDEPSESNIIDNKPINNKSKTKIIKNKIYEKKTGKDTSLNLSFLNGSYENNNLINSSFKNSNKDLKELNNDIHFLNKQDLNNISNSFNISKDNSTNNLLLNTSKNNSSNNVTFLLENSGSIKNNSIAHRRSNESIKKKKTKKVIEEKKYEKISNEIKINENPVDKDLVVTIDKIFLKTEMTILNSIKFIIMIFIVFTIIFIAYFTYKLIVSLLFIYNFPKIITDFKTLTSQYNHICRYWNHMKTLFIIPNSNVYYDLNNSEEYFSELNSRVNNIYKNRIKRYKKISYLYDILLSSSLDQNLSTIDFCLGHQRCYDIRNSTKYLLSNGIESTVNLYAKEIFNYYKDFLELKNTIKTKDDIKKYFIGDKYKILSSNVNHVIIYLEELFFRYFLEDERNIVDNFYLKIKIMNIIEICFCAILNLFSILFVYNFITGIISNVEKSSFRVNNSLKRMKIDISN